MSKNLVRYAVLGCGDHAWRSHIVPGQNVGELELVGVFDPSREAMARLAGRHQVSLRMFESEEECLTDPGVDAVLIASPDRYHVASALAAIEAGKHVMVEKPAAVTADGLITLQHALQLASERRLIFTSCHPRRCDPPYEYLYCVIPGLRRVWGKILSFETDFSYHAPSEGKAGLHTGLMQDHVNHEYDLMIWLLGLETTEAWCLSDSLDRYHVAGRREDGLVFSFQGTRRLNSRQFLEMVRVRFEIGELSLNCHTGKVQLYDHESGRNMISRHKPTNYSARFTRIMENFALSILGDESNYLTPTEIWVNTDICVQLHEQGRSKRELGDLPFCSNTHSD